MKKHLIIIFGLFIFLPNFVSAKENITNEEYNNLLNLGFTEREILNMTEKEFDDNKNLKGEILDSTTEYYKLTEYYDIIGGFILSTNQRITKQEFENKTSDEKVRSISTGYIETAYKKLTTTIVNTSLGYRYKVSLEWKNIPSHRGYDIIGIGIDSNVYISTSFTFQQNYCYSNGTCYSSQENLPKQTSKGGSSLFALPTSSSVTSLSSYLYFVVSKNTSSTITSLNAYGDYAHNTKSISLNNANTYTMQSNGIVLNSSYVNYYDEIGASQATWTGSW